MSRRGAASWVRRHPRATTAITGLALVAGIIGATQHSGQHAARDTAADPSVSSAPASVPATTTAAQRTAAHHIAPAVVRTRPGPSAAPADRSQAGGQTASALLATVAIKGRAAQTGYRRAAFGTAWTDDTDDLLGHNGCDTRNDVLRRDLTAITLKPDSNGCTVLTGTLVDPYTGARIAFRRGVDTSTLVQIDHVVALSDAWQTGAQYWSEQRRAALANDPLELLAVDGPSNESKGDGDAATWLPPNKAYRCAYVARQVAVKARYGLWITPAEHDAIARVLDRCPGQVAPTETGVPPATAAHLPPAHHPVTRSPAPVAVQPAAPAGPGGATARCNDGSYSYAAHHQGACSHHGGVAIFYR